MIHDTPGNSVAPFDDGLLDLPQPVREASDAFRAALTRRTAVAGELAAKREALAGARAADAAAARDAVAAGKTPPASTTDDAADALARAERAVPAAEQLAAQAQAEFLAACTEHFDTLAATLHERRQAVADQAQSALDALAGAIHEAIELDDLARELDLASIRARRPAFKPVRARRRKDPAEAIIAPVREALNAHNRSRLRQAA